jgi:YggT family protein
MIINFYILVIIVDTILSYVPSLKYNLWVMKIRKISNFSLNPIRKLVPADLPLDISPIILILGLKLIEALW